MHHARPRRAGASAPPDDAALALLFQRVHHQDTDPPANAFSLSAHSLGSQDASTTRLRRSSVAVTTKHALAHEVRETERIVHQDNSNSNRPMGEEREPFNVDERQQEDGATCKIPALQDLEELMNELYEVYNRGTSGSDANEEPQEELSIQEREYAIALQQAVVRTLTHATLVKYSPTGGSNNISKGDQQDSLPLGEVRVWLLEMVVRASALSRQLAFALFLNLSVRITAIVLPTTSTQAVSRHAEQMQSRLFHVLVEMLSKAVVVASSSAKEPKCKSFSSSNHQWIAQAVGCLLLFAKHSGGGGRHYRADRLRAFDPQILLFFLKEVHHTEPNGKSAGGLEDQLLELLVVTMYAQEADAVAPSASSNKAQLTRSSVRVLLPLTALEHFGGLNLLLFHYCNSHSLSTRRLLFMVFFDVTCHQQRLKTATSNITSPDEEDENLWRLFQNWDLAGHLASTPGLFTASSSTRTVKKLYASTVSSEHQLPEKYVQHFVNQLRLLIHVDEHYAQSSSLSNTLQLLHDQEKHNVTDALMAKVTQLLLGSSRLEDKFQAERWLAELVTYGASGGNGGALGSSSTATQRGNNSASHTQEEDDPLGESVIFTGSELDLESSTSHLTPAAAHSQISDAGDELEETCCFDEDTSIRIAARNKFWELVTSPSAAHRESFARTLGIFVKRKLGPKVQSPSDLVSIAREINMCLRVVVQQRDTNQRVLVLLILLVFEVCKCEVSYRDRQKQQYDEQCGVLTDGNQSLVHSGSDSIASRIVAGEIALDTVLIKEFLPEFFIHALSVLQLQSHPRQRCRQRCCGTAASSPLVGDVMTSIALILASTMHEAHPMTKTRGSGTQKLLPFMEACDTRVAVTMAKLVVSSLKRSDSAQYEEILSELHADAVESDDEAPLTLSYLHANALLAKWVG